jgi:hypothetical protein
MLPEPPCAVADGFFSDPTEMEFLRVQEPSPHHAGLPAAATAAGTAGTGRTGVRPRRLPQVDRRVVAAIFVGALGTLARAALAESFPQPATAWPWPTP